MNFKILWWAMGVYLLILTIVDITMFKHSNISNVWYFVPLIFPVILFIIPNMIKKSITKK